MLNYGVSRPEEANERIHDDPAYIEESDKPLYEFIKRTFDMVASFIGSAVLAPFFLVVAILIKLEDRGPVFYRGERVGRNGRLFRMYKFRSMVVNAEKMGPSSTSSDDNRITGIGKVLRRYKLDELPQLFNVLRGEMSLVGPRPQVAWAVEQYTREERGVLKLRPGMTDMASIVFRNECEILKGAADPDRKYMEDIHPVKLRLCADYLHRRSFLLDMKLIMSTITVMVKG